MNVVVGVGMGEQKVTDEKGNPARKRVASPFAPFPFASKQFCPKSGLYAILFVFFGSKVFAEEPRIVWPNFPPPCPAVNAVCKAKASKKINEGCKFIKRILRFDYKSIAAHKSAGKPRNKIFWTNKYYVPSLETGGGERTYSNIDIDSNGQKDTIVRACGSGSGFYAEGCTLSVKLAGGGGYQISDMPGVHIINFHQTAYSLSSWSDDPNAQIYVDKIKPDGLERICQ
jgi:hypothetical protein